MWLGGIRSLAIVAIMAMAKIPSVAVDDYENWGDDYRLSPFPP